MASYSIPRHFVHTWLYTTSHTRGLRIQLILAIVSCLALPCLALLTNCLHMPGDIGMVVPSMSFLGTPLRLTLLQIGPCSQSIGISSCLDQWMPAHTATTCWGPSPCSPCPCATGHH
ncbi:uncharacterized protein CLUP02_16512 [Colletotrichum lupini]|uniref:Uncharacterized protein n=1 Tax=Colletotrichum lupini TaxID=145971 RepID=A0A9Q8T824_9PEZI|nr:uncharacterized protein CLUP02_16512 [Colletotrichum lupini]KAK1713624.1 hypothetical protein BDP67DRAFT_42877 [Colletotrichum lupini]UQC90979.1 hypothetical protein CLUP02_16512 [Colletotrichum lupini]